MSETLRVGMVCYPTPGGSGVVATELGMSLAARGHEAHFITSSHPSRLRAYEPGVFLHKVDSVDYPLFQQHSPYALGLAVKIREVAVQHDLHVIHAHYAIPHAASAYLAREMLRPRPLRTMTTLHGTDITLVGALPSYHEMTRFSIEHSDHVTAVSEFLREATRREFRTERPIEVIPNFVDTSTFRPDCRPRIRERLAPAGERVIMHVSNFRPVKNLLVVVDVFAGVAADIPSRLVLVGDGPDRDRAERRAREHGVADRVVFLGDQEYVADLLPAADVFLLPSGHESFGLAALEAMACGVPVVGSRIGGLPEVIVDGETGFLCDPDDVACMRQLVRDLLTDEIRRRDMGRRARERAQRHFERDRIVERYIDAYRRLIAEESG